MGETEPLLECVPNISEGRDVQAIEAIANAILQSGVELPYVDRGVGANRTVFTMLGRPELIRDAVFAMFAAASKHINMRVQSGAHPRIGAVDVCPFIPLQAIDRSDALAFCEDLSKELATRFELPLFLYSESAKSEFQRELANLRRGGYEKLQSRIDCGEVTVDFGPQKVSEQLGASVLGVRDFLIAFNINLKTKDVALAKKIASAIRSKSPHVKAIAWYMPEFDCVQISTNIRRYTSYSLFDVVRDCREEAASLGIELNGSELVGMLPKAALLNGGGVEEGIQELGLRSVREFDPAKRILEYATSYRPEQRV